MRKDSTKPRTEKRRPLTARQLLDKLRSDPDPRIAAWAGKLLTGRELEVKAAK